MSQRKGTKKSNPHTGSTFSDFLDDEGIEAKVSTRASKRAPAEQPKKAMAMKRKSKRSLN